MRLADSMEDLVEKVTLAASTIWTFGKIKNNVIFKTTVLPTALHIDNLLNERVSRSTYLGCNKNEDWERMAWEAGQNDLYIN